MVAVAGGPRADPGEVRTGLRLGVELAPDLLAREDLRDVPLEERRRRVPQQRAGDRSERDAAGDAEVGRDVVGGLLAERPLVGGREPSAAVLGRERDPGVAGVEEPALQGAGGGDVVGGLVAAALPPGLIAGARLEVRRDPRPGLGPELVDVHDRVGHRRPLSEPGPHAQVLAVPCGVAEEPGVRGDAAEVQVLVVLPRVPDPAEDLEARLDELDAGVADERLRHAGRLGPVVVVASRPCGRRPG